MARFQPLALEVLEARTVPARFGVPWSDPRHLTLSFAPDGTPIAGQASNLFATLNAQAPTAAWQEAVLRAVQTWAVKANVNVGVGVVSDGGLPFGEPGLPQSDARFGDIRIGAAPLSPLFPAITVPHDPFLSGTWSGDVTLNSTIDFTAPQTDLYGVLLHELGHAFGLGHGSDPNSVLYEAATWVGGQLADSDVAALQALYGPAPGAGPGDNHTLQSAASLPYPTDPYRFDRATPLVAFGALTAPSQVDFFALRTPAYQGVMTFRFQTAGLSLLAPQLVVYDGAGTVLGQAQSTSPLGDVVTVRLEGVAANALYYVRAASAVSDLFGVGRYALAATFDADLQTPPDRIAAVLRGPFDTFPPDQIDALFRNPRERSDLPDHGCFGTALALTTTPGYAANQHSEVLDRLGTCGAAYYRVQAPAAAPGSPVVLTAAVNALGLNGAAPRVEVFDKCRRRVAADVLLNGAGVYTIQAAGLPPGQAYYLKLTVPDGRPSGRGTVSLVVDFNQPPQLLPPLASGSLTDATPPQGYALYVTQPLLFNFALSAAGAAPGSGVRMTITDATGTVLFDQTALAGQTMSGTVLLAPGAYTVRITAVTPIGAVPVPLSFLLRGDVLTDLVGPVLVDTTALPMYTRPGNPFLYYYPNGTVSITPFLLVPIVL